MCRAPWRRCLCRGREKSRTSRPWSTAAAFRTPLGPRRWTRRRPPRVPVVFDPDQEQRGATSERGVLWAGAGQGAAELPQIGSTARQRRLRPRPRPLAALRAAPTYGASASRSLATFSSDRSIWYWCARQARSRRCTMRPTRRGHLGMWLDKPTGPPQQSASLREISTATSWSARSPSTVAFYAAHRDDQQPGIP
jgi:hypothetical protein